MIEFNNLNKVGRKAVRNVFYMAALSSVRMETGFKAHHEQLMARGKPYKVAVTAVMQKIIILINALLRDNRKHRQIALDLNTDTPPELLKLMKFGLSGDREKIVVGHFSTTTSFPHPQKSRPWHGSGFVVCCWFI